ncbi:hypothetical protein VHUM_03424 [Vanrija humicola]|uniref:Cyclin N-terminal domain-containing protein n=1 Tax=Vanrija humicola TaxID=5417 RepID=A0A7D8UYC8_VANHU|nr:hypothetical protein VHUM_03424 [Vanrija humicola]
MASGIPTRRTTRRVDENAPPAQNTIATRTRSAGAAATSSAPSTATSIPVMKRTTSTLAGSAPSSRNAEGKPSSSAVDGKAPAGKLATKRRAALGELPLASDNGPKDGLKGKAPAGAERRPLGTTQSQQPLRATRASQLSVTEAKAVDSKTAATKRKVGTTTTTRRGPLSRTHSTASLETASTSTSTSTHTARRVLKATASLPEVGQPAPKRLRASSGTPEDVFGPTHYDEDNKEFELATVRLSPKRKAKDAGWTDLDAEDEGDPSMVSEYVVDAFKYMMEIEKNTMAKPDYMDQQDELQWKMRAILIDWIIEVHSKFRLLPETLLIATNLIDRFLSVRLVSLVKFQLVGLTALFVAAKYEEVICPSITHFLHMTDGGYEVEEILRAERYLLSTLEFDLSYPNPLHFLRRVSKADGYDVHARTIAKFFIEISCVEHRLLPYPPSMLAAAAMWLARLCLDRGEWHANMVHYSGYSQQELLPCAQVMLDYVVSKSLDTSSAFYKKYASKKHLKASAFVVDWAVHRWPQSHKGNSPYQGVELQAEFGDDDSTPPPATQ